MNNKEIHYELIDNGGSNAMWIPIILPIGTIFQHEYGTYKVSKYKGEGSGFVILCDRL